jgi:uncharacterized protein with HEPN domain
MSKREPSLLVNDIIESGVKILQYTEGMTYESFLEDSKTIDAVIRNFEIIGEAANRLSEAYKEKYPDIDWFKIRGFRNRIVHDYMGIDFGIVWQIREQFLPDLIERLQHLQ